MELDHVLRAAGEITGEKHFIIIGSQSLHGKCPDLPDEILMSAEVDLIAKVHPEKTESLNFIGVFSRFHETHGYYADPVDESTATLPKGWKGRLVNLPPGDTAGVSGLCLDPKIRRMCLPRRVACNVSSTDRLLRIVFFAIGKCGPRAGITPRGAYCPLPVFSFEF
jgi:hypothetical protein